MQAVRSSQKRRGREENTLNAKASKSATASNKRSTKGEEHRNTSKIISYFETTITANSLTQRYLVKKIDSSLYIKICAKFSLNLQKLIVQYI